LVNGAGGRVVDDDDLGSDGHEGSPCITRQAVAQQQ
jgi:hypothetical protein